MIQVTGVLQTPMKVAAPNVIVRIIAVDTSSESVPTLPASITTGSGGEYDFNLGNGTYSIEINFDDKYNLVSEVTVDNDTISPISLRNLLNLL